MQKQREFTVKVAKSGCFALFGVMKTTSPIDGDVALSAVQSSRSLHTSTTGDTAELKESIKHRTIISNVILSLLLGELIHIVGSNFGQEINVLVRVELTHLLLCCRFCTLAQGQRGAAEQSAAAKPT